MRKEWTLLLLLITTVVQAQYPILQKAGYKPGLYRNFEEFRDNNPSLPLSYKVITDDISISLFNNRPQRLYGLEVGKKEGKKIGPVFGFCDGTAIYIWVRSYKRGAFSSFSSDIIGPKTRFTKLLLLDTLSYFEDIGVVQSFGAPMMGANGMAYGGQSRTLYQRGNLLDLRTGGMTELTKGILRELLQKDPELSAIFEKESGKRRKLGEYLMYYLERRKGSRALPR
ncbi:hypothetical protein [Niabella beijingensis]|uniref:hypothetical protein n=1 Tax=Niabella beijingensis TaxID=2872700 RepID=UPI001CBA8FEA|nr:hypothetical protein [Niabella beijingensis]MBZ4187410.1 hypothetical protein [Niabella beijingensis]